jgi:hypothetical protein
VRWLSFIYSPSRSSWLAEGWVLEKPKSALALQILVLGADFTTKHERHFT